MKKHLYTFSLLAMLMAAGSSVALTGCGEFDDDDYWPFNPPPGWGSNYFYDTRLVGVWELTQYNSQPVGRYSVNYMEFYGGGRGEYYYYDDYELEDEDMAYFCQQSGSTTTSYQINVQYEEGGMSTMAYWFTDGGSRLWMQWQTGGQTQTYIYTKVAYAPR